MRKFKWLVITFLVILIGIQFIPARFPKNSDDVSMDMIELADVNSNIVMILKNSCYDCHSNQVIYPWYSKIKPAAWLLRHDIVKGKDALNFTEWGNLSKRKQIRMLDNIIDEVEQETMPLKIYTLMHKNAGLSEQQKQEITKWAEMLSEQLLN